MGDQIGMFNKMNGYFPVNDQQPDKNIEKWNEIQKHIKAVYDIDMDLMGLDITRQSELDAIYRIAMSIPVESRKEFTKLLSKNEQELLIEAIVSNHKNIAKLYIYGGINHA